MNPQTQASEPPHKDGSQSNRTRWPDGEPLPPRSDPSPAEAFHQVGKKLGELREFVAFYASTRIDMIKLTVRNAGIYLAIAAIGLLAVAAIAITAVVLLMRGIAGGFAQLCSGHPWLGDIITSLLALVILAVGVIFGMKKLTGTFRSLTVKKYEDRLRQERQQFGHDVHE